MGLWEIYERRWRKSKDRREEEGDEEEERGKHYLDSGRFDREEKGWNQTTNCRKKDHKKEMELHFGALSACVFLPDRKSPEYQERVYAERFYA